MAKRVMAPTSFVCGYSDELRDVAYDLLRLADTLDVITKEDAASEVRASYRDGHVEMDYDTRKQIYDPEDYVELTLETAKEKEES